MLTNRITKVRLFYTQHVLPLIYDYSLSFYEALCKIADTLNDTIEAVEELDTRVTQNTTNINNLTTIVNNFDDRIEAAEQNAQDAKDATDALTIDLETLRTQVIRNRTDINNHTSELADHETRISVLEGYAFEGVTPVSQDDMETYINNYFTKIINEIINPMRDEIDALAQGGYTPVYGSVDFGQGVLLKAMGDGTMEIASRDFQVSAAYVQALNMVYGCIYISQSEGAVVDAVPGNKFVLCWKDSPDLPPIAHDFPGVKVAWDDETHVPDLFKMGIDYNNLLSKRVDAFYTPNRDQYPGYLGTGYKWYAPVYLNNISTGSPVENWAIIQIPFCYLSLRSGGMTETDIVNIQDEAPISRGEDGTPYVLARNPVDHDQISSQNCAGWGIEFKIRNLSGSSHASSVYRGGFCGLGRMSRQGTIFLQYKSDSESRIRVFGLNGSVNATIDNKIKAGERFRLVYLYEDQTLTLYNQLGDVVGSVSDFEYAPNNNPDYVTTGILFGYTNDTGGKTLGSYGTIDEFRVFKLT